MAIAQTLSVGTVEAQRDYAAAQAQKILDQLVAMTAQRDALAAALRDVIAVYNARFADAAGYREACDGMAVRAAAALAQVRK